MGLPFYGWDSVAGGKEQTSITMDGINVLMRAHEMTIKWDEGSSEHLFEYEVGGTIQQGLSAPVFLSSMLGCRRFRS